MRRLVGRNCVIAIHVNMCLSSGVHCSGPPAICSLKHPYAKGPEHTWPSIKGEGSVRAFCLLSSYRHMSFEVGVMSRPVGSD